MQISHSLTRSRRVEGSPNSIVRRSIVSEEAAARPEIRFDQIIMRTCVVRCPDSEFSL